MIVFDLICEREHRFEGWFASAEDFDAQKPSLTCPLCGEANVRKLLNSKIKRQTLKEKPPSDTPGTPVNPPAEPAPSMLALLQHIARNTEDVGDRFAEEARRIHYAEAPERSIRGVATREDTKELLEEGIPVMPLPIPPPTEVH